MTARIGLGHMYVGSYECQSSLAEVDHEVPADFTDFLAMNENIHDNNVHEQLQHDLVERMWSAKRLSTNVAAP
jgi:hypothetical protein